MVPSQWHAGVAWPAEHEWPSQVLSSVGCPLQQFWYYGCKQTLSLSLSIYRIIGSNWDAFLGKGGRAGDDSGLPNILVGFQDLHPHRLRLASTFAPNQEDQKRPPQRVNSYSCDLVILMSERRLSPCLHSHLAHV